MNNSHDLADIFKKEFEKCMRNVQRSSPTKKRKRFRSAFTTEQINYLEKEFKKSPYIANPHRSQVANKINMPEKAITVWFQNRRMKEKKEATNNGNVVNIEIEDMSSPRKSDHLNFQSSNSQAIPSSSYTYPLPVGKLPDISKKNATRTYTPFSTRPKITICETEHANVRKKIVDSSKLSINNKSSPNKPTTTEYAMELDKKYTINNSGPVLKDNITVKHEHAKSYLMDNDDLNTPKDLSVKRIPVEPQPAPSVPSLDNLSFCVNPFYPTPYMPASNMLWNPANVIPIISPDTLVATMPNHFVQGSSNMNISKQNCDHCGHSGSLNNPQTIIMHNDLQSKQYVITAVPIPNPNTSL